jgi:hypothetical protein
MIFRLFYSILGLKYPPIKAKMMIFDPKMSFLDEK